MLLAIATWLSPALLGLGACDGGREPPPTTIKSGGPLLYWNQDLRALNPEYSRIATITVGLSNLELLEREGETWHSTQISAPLTQRNCSPPFPIAIAALDIDGDLRKDVAVFDACGNWVALDDGTGSLVVKKWDDYLPPIMTMSYVDAFEWKDGQTLLCAAMEVGGTTLRLPPDLPPQTFTWSVQWLGTQVTNLTMFMPATGFNTHSTLFVQGVGKLARYDVPARGDLAPSGMLSQSLSAVHPVAFHAIDQMARLPLPDCPLTFVGVGRAAHESADPRPLQRFAAKETQYDAFEVDPDLNVITSAVAARSAQADVFVGIIGTRKNNLTVFSLWHASSCAGLEKLAELPIEFRWRTPDQRIDTTLQAVPKRPGVKLLGGWNAANGRAQFVHYDGFELRIYGAEFQDGVWKIVESKQTMYTARADLAAD